jgi:hypothetical protein
VAGSGFPFAVIVLPKTFAVLSCSVSGALAYVCAILTACLLTGLGLTFGSVALRVATNACSPGVELVV